MNKTEQVLLALLDKINAIDSFLLTAPIDSNLKHDIKRNVESIRKIIQRFLTA